MKKLIYVVLLTTFCTFSQASTQIGIIDNLQAMNDGRIVVTLVGTRADKPTCATYNYWLISDENSNAGKAQLSLLLAAHASGRPVSIQGTSSCIRWVDGENIVSVTIPKS